LNKLRVNYRTTQNKKEKKKLKQKNRSPSTIGKGVEGLRRLWKIQNSKIFAAVSLVKFVVECRVAVELAIPSLGSSVLFRTYLGEEFALDALVLVLILIVSICCPSVVLHFLVLVAESC